MTKQTNSRKKKKKHRKIKSNKRKQERTPRKTKKPNKNAIVIQHDSITGKEGSNLLNKKWLSKYDLDDIFNDYSSNDEIIEDEKEELESDDYDKYGY